MNNIEKLVEEIVREKFTNPRKIECQDNGEELLPKIQKMIIKYSLKMELEDLKNIKKINSNKCLKFKKKLGAGGYGSVYQVDDSKAVKVINITKNYRKDKNFIKDLEKEFLISQIADKKGFGPKIYDVNVCCDDKNNCYFMIYMELLKGETYCSWNLSKHSDKEREDVLNILDKKINIMQKNKIIHNDIHDENIFIVKDSKTKKVSNVFIIDYGMAEISTDLMIIEREKILDVVKNKTRVKIQKYVECRLLEHFKTL